MSTVSVKVNNQASVFVFITGDPNWDDQQLMVNGEVIHSPYTLAPGQNATVSVTWDAPGADEMMGVIFSITRDANYDFYQLAIGQDQESGNLAVTNEFSSGQPPFRFTVSDQAPWSMSTAFENA